MKYVLLLCLLPCFAQAQYDISLEVRSLPAPATVTLGYYFAGQTFRIDSAQIDQQAPTAHFKGAQTLQPGVYFLSIQRRDMLDVVVNEPQMAFRTDFQAPFDSFQVIQSLENGPFWNWQRLVRDRRRRIEEARNLLELLQRATPDKKVVKEQTDNIAALEKEIIDFSKKQREKYPKLLFPRVVMAGLPPGSAALRASGIIQWKIQSQIQPVLPGAFLGSI